MNRITPGEQFRQAMGEERPLLLPGAINAVTALQAKRAGFRAIYLSGSGVATASYGVPDLGMTSREDVAEDIRRIASVVDLPLLVDGDTGFGDALNIRRTIQAFERAGAAGLHLEDQEASKRCGHRPNKRVVAEGEMTSRIRAAVSARQDPSFVIMARTDAFATEGLEGVERRAKAYARAGADILFAEAMRSLDDYRAICAASPIPVLANITEFGKTPLFTAAELKDCGVRIALYPLSAFRSMLAAAGSVYRALREDGTQSAVVDGMMTRDELYELIDYHRYEAEQDNFSGEAVS